jgi:alpha-beta hydrolase superfamily lysophospholipase
MTSFDDLPVRELELDLGRIRYRELGRGEPVVLVHGVRDQPRRLAELITAFASRESAVPAGAL